MYRFKNEKGIALVFVFIVMTALSGIAFAFLFMVRHEVRSAGAGLRNAQAFYIAEAGLAKARWALGTGEAVGWGETDEPFGEEGTYTVTTVVDNEEDGTYKITSEGYVPDSANPLARRRVAESGISIESNLSLGATASASSEQGPNTADRAIDDNTGTKWKSKINNGSWLKLDFGSSTTFDKIVIVDAANFDSYTIEYSDDDVTYQGVTVILDAFPTISFNSVSARYLRLNASGNRLETSELETYDVAGGGIFLGQGKFATAW